MVFPIFENISSDIFGYAVDAFSPIDPWFWPFVFLGVIGYIYAAMQSITVAVVGILVTMGVFATTSNVFADVSIVSQFLYIITILGITLLIVGVLIHRQAGE